LSCVFIGFRMHDKATVTERQLVQAVEFDGRSSADIWACMEREGYASETCAAPMVEEAKAAAALDASIKTAVGVSTSNLRSTCCWRSSPKAAYSPKEP